MPVKSCKSCGRFFDCAKYISEFDYCDNWIPKADIEQGLENKERKSQMSIDGINSSMPPMGPPPGAKPPSASQMTSEIMAAKDTDSDGALSIEESGLSQESFNNLDANSDGVIGEDELVEMLTEKLEAMKEKMDAGKSRPSGPPPMGPPPEESTDETEELTDLEQLLEMMNEVGTSMTDSSASSADMFTMVLQELGTSNEDQAAFFEVLQNNGIDYEA